jgi:cytochrome c oxidase subunit 2
MEPCTALHSQPKSQPSVLRARPNFGLALVVIVASGWLTGCAQAAALNPQGPAAAHINFLGWTMTIGGALIWLLVMGLLGVALFRPRPPIPTVYFSGAQTRSANTGIVGGGIVMPVVVLVGLTALTIGVMRAIANITPSSAVVIEVVGHQWWWEVRYPNQAIVTANEIHLPAGQPITLELSSVDVIHSFWTPELHGKLDLIPGQINTLVLQADQPGRYLGRCAEFCGIQHAHMAFVVIAHAPEAFAAWVEQQAQPAVAPAEALALEGQQVFLTSRCVECHTIRGTSALGEGGPDLTHVASRLQLAAGVLDNTAEHLAQWIDDSQALKPGNLMPPSELSEAQLQAIVTYLTSLK